MTAVLFGALSYKNGRDSIYKAKRIDGKDFSGWGIPFKAIQDSPKKWGRHKKRILPYPHWATFPKRSCRDQNFNVLEFTFFILPGELGGK